MPGTIKNEFGCITIAEDAIAIIAGSCATENYGIVGMNSKRASDTLWHLVGGDNQKRGVKVAVSEDGDIDIDLFVTLIYGASIPAVARNAIENVRYRVQDMTGLTVRNVNVFVEAVQS